ncbi:LARGE xylosyl- and glucuronyltransferase 2 [Gracilariopsis chorda]|uniref:LARGE xylosyl-and glucuronyltransferase 2 n=1 Tax=Gracilariopsis chorda TaxID=448386 RepID=A0A2V3IP72_9FLOR|nr:LARGE xylosyl- and glucuronyltransferase 2 [Gracilariopsis chorda]|eukprot:PXF43872.1 LARGE xylosyl- and glucuronyltransferase 2 [Gracilariopsis chorda]
MAIALLLHKALSHTKQFQRPSEPLKPDLPESLTTHSASKCETPTQPRMRPRSLGSTCIRQIDATATRLSLEVNAPRNGKFTIFLQAKGNGESIASASVTIPTVNGSSSFVYVVENLLHDTPYTAILQEGTPLCRVSVFTLPPGNLVQNPSFETDAPPLFLATRFHERETPRSWTPFYNGGAVRHCGPFVDPYDTYSVYIPRSGDCFLLLGPHYQHNAWQSFTPQEDLFYGAHQSVRLWQKAKHVSINAWYLTSAIVLNSLHRDCKSCKDALSLVIGVVTVDGQWHDGATIPLVASTNWTKVCVFLSAPRAISSVHVYFHFHEHSRGHIFVDDVSLVVDDISTEKTKEESCHTLNIEPSPVSQSTTPHIHLRSGIRPNPSQLTIAVPLTYDRILRLEAMSRLYGGGPIVAAVLIREEQEARLFEQVWQKTAWLRNYVDVGFLKRSADEVALPINALRNAAVRLAQTEFVMMLDVDMTPATKAFDCFRSNSSTYLSALLPKHERRIAVLPVFITHIHHKLACDKEELLVQLNSRVGTSYCAHSQKANRVKRWYAANQGVETFFTTDYEPYGIVRRELHPHYDERFSGYGFNKIAWAVAASRWGYSFIVLDDAFVTHLNHVENSWVSDMDVPHYLVTWRRFLGFVSEEGSDEDRPRVIGTERSPFESRTR